MNGIGLINATGHPAIANSFHTLVVQPTSFCNLDCSYCYLPDRRSRRLVSDAVAQACAETGVTIERCAITGSRFTGSRLTDVRLKDVLFDGCRFDYATLQRVTAAGSVAFTGCTLTNGTWSSCRLPRIALRSCDLAGLLAGLLPTRRHRPAGQPPSRAQDAT